MILRFKHEWKSWYYEVDSNNIINFYKSLGRWRTDIQFKTAILDPESFYEISITTSESYESVKSKIEEAKFNDDFEEKLK